MFTIWYIWDSKACMLPCTYFSSIGQPYHMEHTGWIYPYVTVQSVSHQLDMHTIWYDTLLICLDVMMNNNHECFLDGIYKIYEKNDYDFCHILFPT